MAELDYTPLGHTGWVCSVRSAGGRSLEVTLLDRDDDPVAAGGEALVGNLTIVTQAGAYAANEFAARRARDPEKKKGFRKRAKEHRSVALGTVDMVEQLGDQIQDGYCSGCLVWAEHRRVERRSLRPVAYLCSTCGAATTPCLVPRCKHFANRSAQRTVGVGNYCAEHLHAVPGFGKLDTKLASLGEYESWLDFDRRNAKRITTIAGGTLVGGLIVAPVFLVAAPVIGGTIGAWTGLSGAAATSHGLAMLGGGSLASGGLGMIGGTAVVTATGAGLGSALGAAVTTGYVTDDPSFGIELVEEGSGPPVVFTSGFLTEDEHGWGRWERLVRARYPGRPVYRLRWGAKEMKHLRALLSRQMGARGARGASARFASRATRGAASKLAMVGGVFTAAEIAKNPWWVAQARAAMTGAVLADLLARTEEERYVLVGHSLGARVMLETTQALATRTSAPRLESVHLLGAAVDAKTDLHGLADAVSGTVWNYWSTNDAVLARLYRGAQLGQRAAGAAGFRTIAPGVKNRKVSRLVEAHSDYVASIRLE